MTEPTLQEIVLALALDRITLPREYLRYLTEHIRYPCKCTGQSRLMSHQLNGIQQGIEYDLVEYTCDNCKTTRSIRVARE